MRKLTFTLLLSMLALVGYSQLVNDGATITVKNGATLFVETDVTNNGAGKIVLEGTGTLEVQGNLINNNGLAGLQTSATSKIKFSGANASNLNAAGDTIANLELAKTAATNVNLTGAAVIGTDLNFNSAVASKLVLGSNDLRFMGAATTTGADSDEYIVADGSGKVVKDVPATGGSFTYQVGDGSNFSPLASTVTGTSAGSVAVNVVDAVHPNKPADANNHLTRYWNVDQTGITGYMNMLTGTYVPADAVGTAANIKGAVYDGTEWSYMAAATNGSSTVSGSTDDAMADFTGTDFYGKVNVKAFLSGPYNANTNEMNTSLNATTGTNYLETYALTSPYNAAPYNASPASVSAGFFLANPDIVDWVMLELRDPAAPGTATTNRSSAFIKKDGSIVGLSGNGNPTIKGGSPTSVLAIHHRNHLNVRTKNAGINVVNPVALDFRTDTTSLHRNDAITTNKQVKSLEAAPNGPGGMAAYGMWGGDINKDGIVKYNLSNNDRAIIYTAIGGASQNATVTGYRKEDVNMDGTVKYNLSNNDRAIIYQNIGAASQNATVTQHN